MIRVYKHEGGLTECVDSVNPAWLDAASGVMLWVDLDHATPAETRILSDVFHFHELAIEDAVAEIHHPKVESYGDYLYVILHGIDFKAREHCFQTRDVDFFLGPNYLVTVHPGVSRSIGKVAEVCTRNSRFLAEGPVALMHRIVDTMVDNYRPEVEQLQDRLDKLEREIFQRPEAILGKRILDFKRDIASLRRVVLPQRDVVGRLARREFDLIGQEIAYRFRDVYDQFARMADDAIVFQDRVTGIFDAHLATVSNRLANVSKVLAVIAALFGPLTVITGLFGMNVPLPTLFGNPEYQFWEIIGMMMVSSALLFVWFKKSGWW